MKRAIVPASAMLMAVGAKESINGQVWHKTKSGIRWRVHVIALVCVVVICVAPLSARAQRVVTLSNIPGTLRRHHEGTWPSVPSVPVSCALNRH